MKKLAWVLLGLAMMLSLAFAAFATEVISLPSSSSGDITAVFDPGENNVTHAYSVTITWSQSGTLTYHAPSGSYTWNTDTLQYDHSGNTNGFWTVDNAKVKITVENRSDVPVKAVCGTPDPNLFMAIIGTYDQNVLNLPSAAQGLNGYTETGTAQSLTATYTIDRVSGEITSSGKIGSITVELTAG